MALPARLVAVLLAVVATAPCQPAAAQGALEARLSVHVNTLADASMEGRAPGSDELGEAADYVQRAFETVGLEPGVDGRWRQTFRMDEAPGSEVNLPEGRDWSEIELHNVIGVLPGDASDAGGSEASVESGAVVFGAHYDHLGVDGESIYQGADDNASGVAALIEIARFLVEDGPFEHDVIFVAFSGEEGGLFGSRHYVDHPVRPLSATRAMINLDTVGRMEGDRLFVLGSATALEFEETLQGINLGYGFDLELVESGPFASDHVPFAERGVPALHFFSGTNSDYHRVSDTPEKIELEALAKLVEFAAELGVFLADREEPLSFVPPGADRTPPSQPPSDGQRTERRVSLGTIPDFSRESGGVLLSGVMSGSPAEQAGLEKGDILIELGGIAIDNLADFSSVLRSHAPGDEVEVVVKRGDEDVRKNVTLAERGR